MDQQDQRINMMKTKDEYIKELKDIATVLEFSWKSKGELLDTLCQCAKDYRKGAIKSIKRNKHMHRYQGTKINPKLVDAILVDFINYIAMEEGVDYGLYTHYIEE